MVARQRMPFGSTTARFVATVFALQLLAMGGVLYYVQRASASALLGEEQALVGELRDVLVAGFKSGGRASLVNLIDARIKSVHTEIPAILLTTAEGQVLAGNLGAWPPVIARRTDWQTLDLYRKGSRHPERMGMIATVLPDRSHLLTGHVIESKVRLIAINEEAMIAAMLLAIPLTLLVSMMAGYIIDRRVSGVAATAAAVGGGDLTQRVPTTGGNDAFDRLGHAVNAMLERIEALVSELRIVTDSLAHDLRSPITRLKSTLERAIVETRDPDALVALGKVSTEAETLLAMLTTALQIGRAEAGLGRERFSDTDVRKLLTDLVEVYGPYAEERGFALTASADAGLTVMLHRELVSHALGNLIENAIKYAAGGCGIELTGRAAGGGFELAVGDDGPGIPPERRDEARRRFGRLDPARQISGSGLGLSLVEAVARLHRGELALSDNSPGLRASISILR